MAWSICGVTLDLDEQPDEGSIQFVGRHIYVYANPYGATGRLKQIVGTDAREAHLQLTLSRTTKDAIKAVYDAHAADGDLTGLFICPEPPYVAGVQMKMTEFSAEWNIHTPGLPWFECDILLVEG